MKTLVPMDEFGVFASTKYEAMVDSRFVADVLACRYSDDYSRYKVVPLNDIAKKFISAPKELDEAEWVKLLYRIRGREIDDDFLQNMEIAI